MSCRSRVLAPVFACHLVCLPGALWAAPVVYNFVGDLQVGRVGADVTALASRLSPAAFGNFSGSITYDGDTLQFLNDIYIDIVDPSGSTTTVLAGHRYSVTGSATVTLAKWYNAERQWTGGNGMD